MRRLKMKKSKLIDKEDLCYVEEVEENGICEYLPTGTPIAQFTFENNSIPTNEPMLKARPAEKPIEVSLKPSSTLNLPDNRTLKSEPNGITPPIDGEYFVIKRGFTFRRSTIRMLMNLKLLILMKIYI